jgi:hypothetical protein
MSRSVRVKVEVRKKPSKMPLETHWVLSTDSAAPEKRGITRFQSNIRFPRAILTALEHG